MTKPANYYDEKSDAELLEELKARKLNSLMGNADEYRDLIVELTERILSEKGSLIFATILSTDAETLNRDYNLELQMQALKQEEEEENVEDGEEQDTAVTTHNLKAPWYHDWWSFVFTIALGVAIGTLIAVYIIYIMIKKEMYQ